ncbi:MAG: carbohydrate kinase family protein [Lachnospiraceae bacterium]|nr:carbohydrate kinase family protein [Lachnospiraceae bacterium]MBR0153909.1 carbohydrate kinase family protein [Lachnospiraceae bacterium]
MSSEKFVVTAGQICLDISPKFPAHLTYERVDQVFYPGKLSTMDGLVLALGGAVANTGLAMQKMGTKVRFMGKVGTDGFADVVRRMLLDDGGDDTYLLTDTTAETSCTMVLAPRGLDRMFLQVPGANNTFTAEDVNYEGVKGASLFHFGYPGIMRRFYLNDGEELVKMFSRVKELGVATSLDMVFVDPDTENGHANWRQIVKNVIPYVDFFVPSAAELCFELDPKLYESWVERAGGRDVTEVISIEHDIRPLADQLMEWGAKVVMIKCGLQGLYLRTAGAERLLGAGEELGPVLARDWADLEMFEESYVADVVKSGVGAGDASIGAFLCAVLRGFPVRRCLQYAAGAGCGCVEQYDSLSGVPTFEEMDARMAAGWKKQGLKID